MYAAWKDKYYYAAHVDELLDGQRCSVVFDDGSKLVVDSADVIPHELLPVSTDVLALRDDDIYESAVIVRYDPVSVDDARYVVEFKKDEFNCRYVYLQVCIQFCSVVNQAGSHYIHPFA